MCVCVSGSMNILVFTFVSACFLLRGRDEEGSGSVSATHAQGEDVAAGGESLGM